MNTPNPFEKTTASLLVSRRGDAHPADSESTRDTDANLYSLLDWTLAEFIRDTGEPPGHDNANAPLEIESLYDPATYEYEYELEQD